MALYVSRDDGASFMPAVFPETLKQTRYTIMDQVRSAVRSAYKVYHDNGPGPVRAPKGRRGCTRAVEEWSSRAWRAAEQQSMASSISNRHSKPRLQQEHSK